jgi:hypothetical protein
VFSELNIPSVFGLGAALTLMSAEGTVTEDAVQKVGEGLGLLWDRH